MLDKKKLILLPKALHQLTEDYTLSHRMPARIG